MMTPRPPIAILALILAMPAYGQDGPAAAPAPSASPAPDAPAPAAAPHADTPAPAAAPSAAERAEALGEIATADGRRLMHDRDYAARIVHDLDLVEDSLPSDADAVAATRTLRLIALATLERTQDVQRVIDALLASQPRDPRLYAAPLLAAAAGEDRARIVATVETASRNVPGTGWGQLREILDRDAMAGMLQELKSRHEDALRVRLAGALYRIGWPGDGDPEQADYLRSILLDDRLEHDDRAAAAGYAAAMTTPAVTLTLIVAKRYDPLLAPEVDRMALLQRALDTRDQETSAALAAAPADPTRVLDRARYLASLGRDADALALLQPFTRDVRATVAASQDGMWLVNQAAETLIALGRANDGLVLMRRLAALPIESNTSLIGPRINYSAMLWQTGRYADALDQATRLDRESAGYANDYGKLWVASSIACALAGLNRGDEAAPQLARLRADPDINPGALMRAYICLGEDDAAADLIVHRLESRDPDAAIVSLQDFTLGRPGIPEAMQARFAALRDCPRVRAALDRVGRVMSLPLSRAFWGDF